MGSRPSPPPNDRYAVRLDPKEPYLALHHVPVFVHDQDASLRFYRDVLGFELLIDATFHDSNRFIAVAPPDGSVFIGLVAPRPGQPQYELIDHPQSIILITEDVDSKYKEWAARGIQFSHPPTTPPWGGIWTSFLDPDHNIIVLMGMDDVNREIASRRRAATEKLEAERRTAQELAFARQVQARLFPQSLPPLRTLEYAGVCIQARQVGGDYYDFLNLGNDRLGLVIGDISGKGMAAALLMANLQANLRSQCSLAVDDLQRLLTLVNQLFCDNTHDCCYATLFFAAYNDRTQVLHYANCGHLSALLLRHSGALEQLNSTCTVFGLFSQWNCVTAECQLSKGDTLLLYTDGISEACNDLGEEYGSVRLAAAVRKHQQLSASLLLTAILDDVKDFSPHEQQDDLTLLVAKCMA